MGFGRGKGFTSKVRTELTRYTIKSGGGAAKVTHTEPNPTVATSVT